jgi:biotin carboxyl carrier protein
MFDLYGNLLGLSETCMKYVALLGDQEFDIEINGENEIIVDGEPFAIDFHSIAGQPVYSLLINGRSYEALVQSAEEGLEVLLQGQLFLISIDDERQRRLRQTSGSKLSERGEFHLKSPMPGLIISISVREGQEISKGDRLITLESMKMQNELKSPRDGIIRSLRIKPGDNVEQNQVLLTVS